jgi:uncharacterized protein YjbI with pentapeptide repeats
LLSDARFAGAILVDASLARASFSRADLAGVNLSGAEGVGRNEQLAMLPELRSLTKRRMAHNVLERV